MEVATWPTDIEVFELRMFSIRPICIRLPVSGNSMRSGKNSLGSERKRRGQKLGLTGQVRTYA